MSKETRSGPIHYFDHAATTQCCREAGNALQQFSCEDFGNPSSTHFLGQRAALAIQDARAFFGKTFQVKPEQIIFTGSGTESDNLAILGIGLRAFLKKKSANPGRIIVSTIEHPAVRQAAESLREFGFDVQLAEVDQQGQIILEKLLLQITSDTVLVSIMSVNNIVGSIQPISEIARAVKAKNPNLIFHTDAIQAFGKVPLPTSDSAVDLVSVSAHKIQGPKGIGALILLNPSLLKSDGLRPVTWGGGQEQGLRSGTQSPALIAAFHCAAQRATEKQTSSISAVRQLNEKLRAELVHHTLLSTSKQPGKIRWNSPDRAVPHIVSLSLPHYPTQQVARLLEKHGCIVSTGSACSAGKNSEEKILVAMGLPTENCLSAIRISLSDQNTAEDIQALGLALKKSLAELDHLLGSG